jgi:hypothetical protein
MAPHLRAPFPGADKIIKNYSQAWQDLFVLSMLSGIRGGRYLEVGGQKPIKFNNTFLLHHEFDWSGVSLDLDPVYAASWARKRPRSKFIVADALEINYSDALPRWFAGDSNRIDYLQLDIDPSFNTLRALKKLPLDSYRFSIITFETDAYSGDHRARDESRAILSSFGYELVCKDVVVAFPPISRSPLPFEDWWVDPRVVSRDIIFGFQNINIDVSYPQDFLFSSQTKSI